MKKLVKKMLKSCAIGKAVYEPLHSLYRKPEGLQTLKSVDKKGF